jgi:cell division protein ZapA
MAGSVQRVNVEIMGEKYIIKGLVEAEHIEGVSNFLKDKLDDMQSRNPQLSEKRIAILTAFNMADELLRIQKDYAKLAQLLDHKNTGLDL